MYDQTSMTQAEAELRKQVEALTKECIAWESDYRELQQQLAVRDATILRLREALTAIVAELKTGYGVMNDKCIQWAQQALHTNKEALAVPVCQHEMAAYCERGSNMAIAKCQKCGYKP